MNFTNGGLINHLSLRGYRDTNRAISRISAPLGSMQTEDPGDRTRGVFARLTVRFGMIHAFLRDLSRSEPGLQRRRVNDALSVSVDVEFQPRGT